MKPIKIFGFTPLGVILAERLTYSLTNTSVHLIEQESSSLFVDTQWQSVSLLCLINLLKQARLLQSNDSKRFGIYIRKIKMNKQCLYSYIKLATERVQKYYLTLLKQRLIQFELFNYDNKGLEENQLNNHESNYIRNDSIERLLNIHDLQLTIKKPWLLYFRSSSITNILSFNHKNNSMYITYMYSSNHEFNQSLRLNVFHTIFQYLLSYSSVKLIGPDIFAFELAYLLSCLGHHQIYFYRMHPNQTSILPITETNSTLVTLFEIFSKSIHEPLIDFMSNINQPPILRIIEQYHRFQMNIEGQLEYEKFIQPSIPTHQTPEETKKYKRTYLETFKQRTQESIIKFSRSNVHINVNDEMEKEAPLDYFPSSSTFLILIDQNISSDLKPYEKSLSFPTAIRTFNSTPGALISTIYETLRKISDDKTIPQLTNIFLSVDHELCVIKSQTTIKPDRFGSDHIFQSQQHDLKRSIENLHDLYKIIQRPVNELNQLILYESQLFQNDALDLQSLLLLFDSQQEIPHNELIFLFSNDYDWHNLITLPDLIATRLPTN